MKKLVKTTALLLCLAAVFTLFSCTGKKTEKDKIKIGVLKGPTGMGAVKLKKDSDDGLTEGKYSIEFYETANVSNLNRDIINGTLDIAALPVNAGASLYAKNDGKVQVLAVNALGGLSFVGKEDAENVASLKGKTIHTTGQASTPEYILSYILTENGLDPENDVNIVFYADGSSALKGMLENGGVAMLPEPATSAALAKNKDLKLLFSVNDEWAKVSNTLLVQGCLIVNKAFAEKHGKETETFLKEYKASVDYINSEPSGAALLLAEYGIIEAASVAKAAIPRAGIVLVTGSEMKTAVSGMLGVLYSAAPASIGGKLPEDGYYYGS